MIFSPNVGIQCQARDSIPSFVLGIQCITLLIRLEFNVPFGITSQSFKLRSMYNGIHKYMWYSFPVLTFNVKPGIQSQSLYLTLQCNVHLVFMINASFGIESQPFKLNSIQNEIVTL